MNSFPYTNDNKRYHTFNYDLRQRYGSKGMRIPLNTYLSCPNRDGTCGLGGCSFCNEEGSGEFVGNPHEDLMSQYQQGITLMRQKWPDALPIPYFQAFTNTYAPLAQLKTFFDPFADLPEVLAISIATRADCLSDETIDYLDSLCDKKDIYLELGLQSIHDSTAKAMNRGHDYKTFLTTFQKLKKTRLKIVVHLMNGYPTETKAMMVETAKVIGQLRPYGIKIHMLNVLDHTSLGAAYQIKPFELITQEEYEDLVIHQLQLIPPEVVLMRLTGDGDGKAILAPLWVKHKKAVLNGIDKKMSRRNLYQGDLLK
jgi:radical SAM protein (TIGR01212 family)